MARLWRSFVNFLMFSAVLAVWLGSARAQIPFEADIQFPAQGDQAQLAAAPQVRTLGDSITGTRTVNLPQIDDMDVHMVVGSNNLGPDEACQLLLDVTVNGIPAGTLTVRQGDAAIDAFLTAAEPILPGANNEYVFVIRVAEELPVQCGAITLPNHRDNRWHLERQEPVGVPRPRGAAGGPYEVNEGGTVAMAAIGTDPAGAELRFAWDFDADGQFDDGEGPTAVFDAAVIDGPETRTVGLQLSNAGGAARVLQATVQVKNVAPTFDRNFPPPTIGVQEQVYRYVPRATDPCPLDPITYTLLRKPETMTVAPDGLVEWTPTQDMVGRSFQVRLQVADPDGGSDVLEWEIRVVADPNTPSVNAGENRTVDPGCQPLRCVGTDPRNRALVYRWELKRGPAPVTFRDQDQGETTVVLSMAGEYTFTCTATEDVPEDQVPLESPPDEVVLTVRNLPPVADPGFPATGKTYARITLDGRRSVDPNGDALRYQWVQTSGEAVRIAGVTNPITSFSPQTTDIYCFELIVQDPARLESEPAPICIVVNEAGDPARCARNEECRQERCIQGEEGGRCQPFTNPNYNPIAWAGEDQWALVGQQVLLSGMRSYDPDGQAPFLEEYNWQPCSPLAEEVVLDGQGTMRAKFVPQQPGFYCYSLTVRDTDGHRSVPAAVRIMVETPDNQAPWADPGAGVAVQIAQEVRLDATLSRDPEGAPLTFEWTQVRGPAVVLDDPTSPTPSFCAAIPAIYQFNLVVRDDKGLQGLPAEAWVTVTSSCNLAPVAKAGPPIVVKTDDGVNPEALDDKAILDGRQSFDPDPSPVLDRPEDGIKFQWIQTGGMPVELQLPFTRRPWFRTTKWGLYTFRLFMLDAWPEPENPNDLPPECWQAAWSLPSDAIVTVNDPPEIQNGNAIPVANAGPDIDCLIGEDCYLDGRDSSDANADELSFRWFQVSGKPLLIKDLNTATPHFLAEELGEWTFRLWVSDGYITSLDDVVKVRVRPNDNVPPLCRAGHDQAVEAGEQVVLNGCGSLDENGDALTFTWSQVGETEVPDFTQGEGDDQCKASFVAPETPGNYVFQLVANDGRVDCTPDTITITVEPKACVCEAGEEAPFRCECDSPKVHGKRFCKDDCTGWGECEQCVPDVVCTEGDIKSCGCIEGGYGDQACVKNALGGTEWEVNADGSDRCTNCQNPPVEGEGESGGSGGDSDGCKVSGVAGLENAASSSIMLGLLLGIGLLIARRRG